MATQLTHTPRTSLCSQATHLALYFNTEARQILTGKSKGKLVKKYRHKVDRNVCVYKAAALALIASRV